MKRKNWIENSIFIGAPILFLLFWYVLGITGNLNEAILPTPVKIFNTFLAQLENGKWTANLKASIVRVAIGYVIGSATGILVGIMTGIWRYFERGVALFFGIVRSIPMMGLVPLFILWFGIGETSKIVVIAIGTFWSVLLNTQHGIQNVSNQYVEVARLFEKTTGKVLTSITFPSAFPSIFTGLRLGISSAWKCVVAAEMLGATRGLGYSVQYAREMSRPAEMFVGLLTIGIFGQVIDLLIIWVQKKIIKWS